MYLTYADKFIYLLFSNVEKVVFEVIEVAVIELVFVEGYVSYVNDSVKLGVLDVIDICGVVAY